MGIDLIRMSESQSGWNHGVRVSQPGMIVMLDAMLGSLQLIQKADNVCTDRVSQHGSSVTHSKSLCREPQVCAYQGHRSYISVPFEYDSFRKICLGAVSHECD
jgi:hypothetical protein